MTRCPKTARPRQFRGRARYGFAGVTFQCVLEAGHTGPCGMEPVTTVGIDRSGPGGDETVAVEMRGARVERVLRMLQTPEQIAAGDARYREHLRRKRAGR